MSWTVSDKWHFLLATLLINYRAIITQDSILPTHPLHHVWTAKDKGSEHGSLPARSPVSVLRKQRDTTVRRGHPTCKGQKSPPTFASGFSTSPQVQQGRCFAHSTFRQTSERMHSLYHQFHASEDKIILGCLQHLFWSRAATTANNASTLSARCTARSKGSTSSHPQQKKRKEEEKKASARSK